MTDAEAEQLCQVFADGLESGIGHARIFDLLERNGLSSTLTDRLRTSVLEDGDRLAEAFARHGILDPTARKLVLVAEDQGKLPTTFEQLGAFYKRRYDHKIDVITSLIEPLILVALGGIVCGNLFGSDLVAIALSSETWARLSDLFWTAAIQVGLFGVASAAALGAWLYLPVDFGPRDFAQKIWLRIPVLSTPSRQFSISRFCRFLKQSIASGLDVYRSMELAAEAANNPRMRHHLQQARTRLKDGASLAESLYSVESLPDEVIEHVEIGEESGRLEERLEFLAERFEERAKKRFDRQMRAILWVVRYAIVFAVVGSVLLSVITLPI